MLTENKVVTKLYAGQPVTRRDIMSLADWQIVVKSLGQEIQTDYLPCLVTRYYHATLLGPPRPTLDQRVGRATL